MIAKQARQFAIKEIVGSHELNNQSTLQRELKKRGFHVTQATLSRDLQELGVNRAAHGRKRVYILQSDSEVQTLRPLVGAEVLSITANESLVVIHTLPACANTVGEFIDVHRNPDIIGTVAGDNTILVIPRSHKCTAQVLQFLKHQLIEGRE